MIKLGFSSAAVVLSFICLSANAQSVTTQETITRSVTVTMPAEQQGSSPCIFQGRVHGLDPHGDNFLSVRLRPNGPVGLGEEVDRLFTYDTVCVASVSGRWLNVRYQRNNRMFSGWVYDRYIAEN